MTGSALLVASVVALLGASAGVLFRDPARRWIVGLLTSGVGLAALIAAVPVIADGSRYAERLSWLLPFSGFDIVIDPLGALFMVISGGLVIAAGIYWIGYAATGSFGGGIHMVTPLFALSLVLLPATGSVASFLLVWELMALTSLVIVFAEHRHDPDVRSAGTWYGAMTQAGFALIMIGMFVLAVSAAGGTFDQLAVGASHMSSTTRSVVFVLLLAGFGSKAGAVPLHVWLPKAHPAAPSHASALMSGAMVNMGIYGILRMGFDVLGIGPSWWWLLTLGIGAISALFGILHALASKDVKRVLAFSTTENVGLILIGIGATGLFISDGAFTAAAVTLSAALLHTINHAAFKGLLFMGAGSVVTSTGTRDLDRMGGLIHRMRYTSVAFAIGGMALAGLPPLNGFISEWLLLQGLLRGASGGLAVTAVAVPLSVAVVALTGGLAATAFVRLFGTGFLAQPRSANAASSVECRGAMRAGMALPAAACVVLALIPGLVVVWLGPAISTVSSTLQAPASGSSTAFAAAGTASRFAPLLIVVWLLVGVGVSLALVRDRARRRRPTWACGLPALTPDMEYTATSFAEPLTRVFDDVLRPDHDIDVTHHEESEYFVQTIRVRSRIADSIETHLYLPVIGAVRRFGGAARALQNGSVHRYLAYGFVALIVALLVAR